MTLLLRRQALTQIRQLHKNVSIFNAPNFDLAKETKSFQDMLPDVIDSAVSIPKLVVPEIRDFVKGFMEYMLPDQKQRTGFEIVVGYRILEKPENITEQSLHDVRVMGWFVELFQAYMFMLDDILDDSQSRWNKPCWHQLPGVGLNAVNDGFLIHALMTDLIRGHFGKSPHYDEITKIFERTIMQIFIGQYLDGRLRTISYENYLNICKFKTTPYFVYFPFQLILCMLKNNNLQMNEEITDICLGIGNYVQMKNDYEDVYGDENVIGKDGTDIQEGKCSWLAAVARQRCDDSQRAIFDQHYGSKEPGSVDRVKRLYDELQMPVVYERDRESLRENLVHRINTLPLDRLKAYFYYRGNFKISH